ncbi:MAG: prepilin-type N-terminal cleavage/methylation domain-containing protein, partial [Nitrospinaceae bacterium]|nr:prepilin-type N-terminal cleavage/methylation domain-containing protein [Nitrospinaceae bacterium]NIR55159.1 prepilin-type N-terminal cleavage/methylation domain-containing protein [Nitrospinaceae bacterium]NIS85583.1 prepilin-type N-terminal cleavage/methylation domain-containing protein [Nitrospinaceae bacterium]NIT82429.1 prepilin-type N-terminal cleavage/methylation domain-containing protein [Nitrospinaceae bacterium]NIU44640.1 prepilin-type N-terminal cleavage/methylation domain-contain
MKVQNSQGFTLNELLITIVIIGILAAISIPAFAHYKARAYDSETKSHLHNIFLVCKMHGVENGSGQDCTVPIAGSARYGYTATTKVNITPTGGELTFSGSP